MVLVNGGQPEGRMLQGWGWALRGGRRCGQVESRVRSTSRDLPKGRSSSGRNARWVCGRRYDAAADAAHRLVRALEVHMSYP